MKVLRWCAVLFVVSLGFALACQATKAPEADVREPAVAGAFYPDSASKLKLDIEKFMEEALPARTRDVVAIIAPHAGYVYSGKICADAFGQVKDKQYDVIVILGTNHTTRGFEKISVHPGTGFRTPLGIAPIEREIVSEILAADPDDCVLDKSVHAREHSVEVIVPFVQVVFPEAKIVPVVVGSPDVAMCTRFGQALAKVVKNRRALIIASSDLSHYPAAEDAVVVDRKTLKAITTLDPALLHSVTQSQMNMRVPNLATCACGEAPVMAAMAAAKALGATQGEIIKYANSGDVPFGDKSRVVGYGAVVLTRNAGEKNISKGDVPSPALLSEPLSLSDKKALLTFARESISRKFSTDTVPPARGFSANLQQPRGVFVTLKKRNELRGCIGRIIGDEPLGKLTGAMAWHSAFDDPRFNPVTADELRDIEIEISVLTPLKEVSGPEQIVVGRDGVLLVKQGRSAVFLPQVATEQKWNRDETLDNLCAKADLPRGCWKQGAQLLTFQAVVFSEADFK